MKHLLIVAILCIPALTMAGNCLQKTVSGDSAYTKGNYSLSASYYNQSIECWQKTNNTFQEIYVLSKLSIAKLALRQLDSGLYYINKAHTNFKHLKLQNDTLLSRVLNNAAVLLDRSGQPDSALQLHQQALKINQNYYGENSPELQKNYKGIADIHRYHFRDYFTAEQYYQQSLNLLQQQEKPSPLALANLYYNLASLNRLKGDFALAETYAYQAQDLYFSINESNDYYFNITYSLLANIYYHQSQYEKAINYYRKIISKKLQPNFSIYYHNLSSIYLETGNMDSCLYFANQSLSMQQVSQNTKAGTYQMLGQAYRKENQLTKSEDHFLRSLALNKKMYGVENSVMALLYKDLGILKREQKDTQKSLQYFDSALYALDAEKITFTEVVAHQIDIPALIEVLNEKGATLLFAYEKYGTQPELLAAAHNFNLLHQILNHHKNYLFRENSTLVWAEYAKKIYEKALTTNWYLYKQNPTDSLIALSLSYMESNKSIILSRAMRKAALKNQIDVPEAVLNRERQLQAQIFYYENQSANADNQSYLFRLQKELDSLHQYLSLRHPNYYRTFHQITPIDLNQYVQYSSQAKASMINYFLGQEALFTIVINDQEKQFLRNNNVKLIEENIDRYQDVMQQNIFTDLNANYQQFTEAAYLLYRELIAQVNLNCQKVVVLPDSKLFFISFESLISQQASKSSPPDFRNLAYLIQDHQFTYFLNLEQLHTSKSVTMKNPKVYGFSYGETANTGQNLLYANAEISYLKNLDAQLFQNEAATEGNFRQAIKEADILHLAIHGEVNQDSRLDAHLVFQPAMVKQEQDNGIVNLADLYEMDIKAQLVLLNACETGLGKINEGEGVYHVARGFVYSGVNALVMSLWKLNDQSSAEIYTSFYENMDNKNDLPYSLRQAKLAYLEKADNISSHPKFWGASVYYGDMLKIKSKFRNNIVLLIIIPLIILIVYLFFTRNYCNIHIYCILFMI